MVGETIPKHCVFIKVFTHNFPLSGTMIPLSTMESAAADTPQSGTNWFRTCGYKSYHPNGATSQWETVACGWSQGRSITATTIILGAGLVANKYNSIEHGTSPEGERLDRNLSTQRLTTVKLQ